MFNLKFRMQNPPIFVSFLSLSPSMFKYILLNYFNKVRERDRETKMPRDHLYKKTHSTSL